MGRGDRPPARAEVSCAEWETGASVPLSPEASRWLASLEPELRPTHLAKRYPRVANALASFWGRPDRFPNYLGRLLDGARRARSGVSIGVARELHSLKAYHAALYPDVVRRSRSARISKVRRVSK